MRVISEIALVHPEKLKNFLKRFERNEFEIDEIVSQALLIACANRESFRGASSIETWFYGICKNVARRHVAKKVRESLYVIKGGAEDSDFMEYFADEHSCPLDEVLIKKEAAKSLDRLISRLSDDLRYVFSEVYLEGRSYVDVAEELKIPLGTLKSRIGRLRAHVAHAQVVSS